MEEISRLLTEILNIDFIRAVISNPRDKTGIIKIKARPLEKKGELFFQLESFTRTQAFHENLSGTDACRRLTEYMGQFGQMQIETVQEECTVLVSKKGKVTIKRKRRQKAAAPADRSHNRKKHYILEEGIPVPFLQDLGVMTEEGKIVRTKTDKFRQINRFLEFVEDILPRLDKGRELTILDFGCGKSYLTFAMYYYLHDLKGYDIRIIGLDLKSEVIAHCGKLAKKYGYEKLTFLEGDIADYDGVDQVDMVVTLHACDTATDYALAKAVGWGAEVILSVPCCQHELNAQFAEDREQTKEQTERESCLAPVMDYGLLRERFAALATDGLRAKYLESVGYETQVLEFIDMEHTPKNILIRAVKSGKENEKAAEEIKKCIQFLGVSPTLGRLLGNKGENS
ncbi:MAG TPA: SAM-dependent methyltransferase [Candidatus Mediterraneibacter stercorigallinarum]|uniref:SAM-dependent methyltransferase n=1 Tax=Candidatus Mediterraneibacter stercorigallinarum TaxID=2838686 RepID=A0A9D2DBS8_9FIRM|nr:SAM-dependent methyltransferase [Candidatus Mediterraneibacter stercorigallinarum]